MGKSRPRSVTTVGNSRQPRLNLPQTRPLRSEPIPPTPSLSILPGRHTSSQLPGPQQPQQPQQPYWYQARVVGSSRQQDSSHVRHLDQPIMTAAPPLPTSSIEMRCCRRIWRTLLAVVGGARDRAAQLGGRQQHARRWMESRHFLSPERLGEERPSRVPGSRRHGPFSCFPSSSGLAGLTRIARPLWGK